MAIRLGRVELRSPLRLHFSDDGGDGRRSVPTAGEEFGFSGVQVWAGLVEEDYNPDLRGSAAIEVYDKMRRSDAQVQAVEMVITLPIRATPFTIEPFDDSPSAQEAAELVRENLFGGMTITFDDFLRDALLALFYGYVPFEKVFEERDGRVVWRKFASRHPRTVERWHLDDQGGLAGIQQAGVHPTKGWQRVPLIPIEKLIVFIYRKEFGNPEGLSVLRSAYPHWMIKQWMYKCANVMFERAGAGVPWGKLPEGATREDRDAFKDILERFRIHESGAIVTPAGYEIENLARDLRQTDLMNYIEHHDLMIARAVLAQFLNLGTGTVGSWALSRDHSQLFLMSLNSVARWFCNHVNRYAIQQLCQLNFGKEFNAFPTLKHTDLKFVLKLDDIAEALSRLVQGQLISPDRALEDYVRDIFGLPALPREQTEAASERYQQVDMGDVGKRAFEDDADGERERRRQQEDAFQAAMRTFLERVHARLQRQVEGIADEYAKAGDAGKGTALQKLTALEPQGRTEYERLVRDYLRRVLIEARAAVADEYKLDIDDPAKGIPSAVRQFINVRAQTLARHHFEDLRAAVIYEALELMRQGLPKRWVVQNTLARMSEKASAHLADLVDAGEELIDLLNEALIEQGGEGEGAAAE